MAAKRRESSSQGGPEEGRRGTLGKDVFLEKLLREMLQKASAGSGRSVTVDGPFSRLDNCKGGAAGTGSTSITSILWEHVSYANSEAHPRPAEPPSIQTLDDDGTMGDDGCPTVDS